jgi:hypothetical protein
MRLRRTILLGLGPLLSLWAMTAHAASDTAARLMTGTPEQRLAAEPFDRLLHPVVSFLILASSQGPAAGHRIAPSRETLSLDALQSTPFGHSLWLVRGIDASDLHARRNRRPIQRC